MLVIMFAGAVLGVLGPIGLLVAFRLIAQGHVIRSRVLRTMLIAGPIVLGAIYVGGSVIIGGLETLTGWAPGVLLLFVLPVAGAAHMLYLGQYVAESKVAT